MRTTLDLPDPLFREVKSRAAREGMKLKELIACYIEAGLRSATVPTTGGRGHPEPLPVAIPREAGRAPGQALTNRELQALLEEEDFENYERSVAPTDREPG
ncbi:MAG: hypothetical protein WD342_06685 [Verrucomicrobiales bacterium]